ncbi:UDP-N-acetylmuramate:L-alanyl-gamma-D-glutamyl-meso-diaminopimelate ligase [Aliidiomarina celeris]|uniref:UDP-N-acetylmuramate:L-alanyl-gamma-D-glutamyl- meso-diaminopimelate ligase n=1 Tax=Aliidiomarina celeris TaxID=2249428 RepID=UPI0018E5F7DD|nr:UDP-N-acetylmuramate:L-alanyl-gamma-D-glutamyl-meso-diaminopimelate ligase [Aliidiomarina celeris]
MAKHIHILGICGTFMVGVAALARELGYRVTGWDQNVYPPMSTQLERLGIELTSSLSPEQFSPQPDVILVGNAMSRGHPLVEHMLEQGMFFQSGPQWLGETLLRNRHVFAVAGTHGKTTTASMLTAILEHAGLAPSFLVGGVVKPFEQTARLTNSRYFVIEADEYDTAFFDKRSKFLHYFPNTFLINNLEFDHADIFADITAIQRQFAHGLRLVPASGQVVTPAGVAAIDEVLTQGCWSERITAGVPEHWFVSDVANDGSSFNLHYQQQFVGKVNWNLLGQHNVNNALMAAAAAAQAGVSGATIVAALENFSAPARRMEIKAELAGITLYDDFAHHPTAIETTLAGLRAKVGAQRVVAIFEARSNTMKAGVHRGKLAPAFAQANCVYALQSPATQFSLVEEGKDAATPWVVESSVEALLAQLLTNEQGPAHWVIMSNGGFDGIHAKLIAALSEREAK